MNTYLTRKREQYDQMRASIEALQTRAADEQRDLTDTEMTSVHEQGEQLRTLHAQITELSEIETRNRQVAELASRVAADTDDHGDAPVTGRAHTRDRDPGHYTRSSSRSFFGDLYLSRQGDHEAGRRAAPRPPHRGRPRPCRRHGVRRHRVVDPPPRRTHRTGRAELAGRRIETSADLRTGGPDPTARDGGNPQS